MFDFKRIRFWWLVISIQVLLTAVVPSAVLLMLPAEEAPVSLEMPGMRIENQLPGEAYLSVEAFCESIVAEGAIFVETEEGQIRIPYSDVGLQIDIGKLRGLIQDGQSRNRFHQVVGNSSETTLQFVPDIYLNEALFTDAFSRIREIYHVNTQNAVLTLQDGVLSVTPHSDGSELDIKKTLAFVKQQLQYGLSKEIAVTADPQLFSTIRAEITEQQLQRLSVPYGLNQGDIPPGKADEFKSLVQSLENRMIKPGEVFSLKERMASFNPSDPLVQLLASGIYRAVLPLEDVRILWRKASNQPVSGIEPGLEVSLENEGDLQFKNTSDTPLMLVFQVTDSGRYSAAVAGNPGLRSGEIKTQQTRIQPSIIYSQSNTLPEDAKEVLEPGKEGLSVKVYRVIDGESAKLYEDVYQPIHKIIAVGTGITKEELVRK